MPDELHAWPRYAEGLLMLMKARRGRTLLLGLCLAVFFILLLSAYTDKSPLSRPISNYHPLAWRPSDAAESLAANSTAEEDAAPSSTASAARPLKTKEGPTFRLLIPAAKSDSNFCRAILTTMLLDYPPPTILGYNVESTIIESIDDHLRDPSIKDDDLVLIVDGYRSWFQLPASVLISQYQRVLDDANARLREKYGLARRLRHEEPRPVFRQTVVWAADEHCWHSTRSDVACIAVPESPFWEPAVSSSTGADASANVTEQKDPYNPKFMNSGTVIGPARDLRAIFTVASKRAYSQQDRTQDFQHMLQTLFSEQEQAREEIRRANLGATGRIREWFSQQVYGHGLGFYGQPLRGANLTVMPGETYEYSMGLDYNSTLFQSMSPPHSFNGDIQFNASSHLPSLLKAHLGPFALPAKDAESASIPANLETGLSITPDLDLLPPVELPWTAVPLARNHRTRTVPATLHFPSRETRSSGGRHWEYAFDSGDTGDSVQYLDPRDQLWTQVWFYGHARALLRRYMRRSTVAELEDEIESVESDGAASRWWRGDERGGKGGVWTQNADWLAWGDVCAGFEEEVFGDGKGVWMEEREPAPAADEASGQEAGGQKTPSEQDDEKVSQSDSISNQYGSTEGMDENSTPAEMGEVVEDMDEMLREMDEIAERP